MRVAATSPAANLAGSSDLRPAGKRGSGKRNRPVSWAKAELESWLAAAVASPPDSVSAVTAQTVDMVSEGVANAVIDALHQNGYHWSDADHVVCAYLAATARAMQELQGQFDRAVERIVSLVLASKRREHRLGIPEPVAKVAAQAAINELSRLSVIRSFDDLLRATRILAVMKCPAPEHHRAVVRYCLRPLEKEVLSEVTKQTLADSLPRGR
jgi:hypothetical protein